MARWLQAFSCGSNSFAVSHRPRYVMTFLGKSIHLMEILIGFTDESQSYHMFMGIWKEEIEPE